MDLNRVALFRRVVEDGGFSAAARTLGMPKSSVSRAVSELEAELGVRLLQRTTRSVRLTDAGHVFHERAVRGLAGLEEAEAAVRELKGKLEGTIRITAPLDAGLVLLEPAVSAFVRAHPGVYVDVVVTARVVDLVAEGFDLAFRAGVVRDGSLVAKKVGRTTSRLFAAPAYLERRGAPKALAELAAHDCVLFRPVRGRATWALGGPAGREEVDVSGPLGADDLSFVRRAVASGLGIGLLPAFIVAREVARKRLVHVLPDYAAEGAPLSLVYPSARHLPRRVAVFRDFLAEWLKTRSGALSGA
ncbi:LysR family transcriptional regulator [Myxococcota bacterium]|nr:LysR family transcriptional regulator [Myxococcota bacterium]